jgi:hypothetical protein
MALLSHPAPRRLFGPRRSTPDPPPGPASAPPRFSPGRAAAGAGLALAGLAGLVAQVYIFNCGTQACDRLMMNIGLALSAALAAIAQLAIIVGLWLLWTAWRRTS